MGAPTIQICFSVSPPTPERKPQAFRKFFSFLGRVFFDHERSPPPLPPRSARNMGRKNVFKTFFFEYLPFGEWNTKKCREKGNPEKHLASKIPEKPGFFFPFSLKILRGSPREKKRKKNGRGTPRGRRGPGVFPPEFFALVLSRKMPPPGNLQLPKSPPSLRAPAPQTGYPPPKFPFGWGAPWKAPGVHFCKPRGLHAPLRQFPGTYAQKKGTHAPHWPEFFVEITPKSGPPKWFFCPPPQTAPPPPSKVHPPPRRGKKRNPPVPLFFFFPSKFPPIAPPGTTPPPPVTICP